MWDLGEVWEVWVKKLWQTLKVCQNVWRIIVVLSFVTYSAAPARRLSFGASRTGFLSFAHPSLKVRSRFGGILIFELGTSCKLAPAEVLTPVEGVRKVLFRKGDLPIAPTM